MDNEWECYTTGEAAQKAMLAACAHAKKSIDLEQYIFEDDLVGRKFLMILLERVNAGVNVRVLADAFGSHSLFSSPAVSELRAAGIEFEFFNPIEPWWLHKLLHWFLRDHRKLMVIDETVAFLGGVGISDHMRSWRDTHLRLTGPIVPALTQTFNRFWEMTKKGKRFFRFGTVKEISGALTLLTNAPYVRERFAYRQILARIRSAKEYVYLTTPYFIPNGTLLRVIRRARERGVDVRLIVPEKSDLPIVHLASQAYFARMLRVGVRMYQYQGAFLHAKSVIIDDAWASVGSSNLDNYSLLLNYELNIGITDRVMISELKMQFVSDTEQSKEIERQLWLRRSWLRQFLELLTWPLRRLL